MVNKTITKDHIADEISNETGLSKAQSNDIVNDIVNLSIDIIKEDKKLRIPQFGIFSLKKKNSRIGRNPKTKEEYMIPARSLINFKPSEIFKSFLNS